LEGSFCGIFHRGEFFIQTRNTGIKMMKKTEIDVFTGWDINYLFNGVLMIERLVRWKMP
jgi:hypothetical protein